MMMAQEQAVLEGQVHLPEMAKLVRQAARDGCRPAPCWDPPVRSPVVRVPSHDRRAPRARHPSAPRSRLAATGMSFVTAAHRAALLIFGRMID